MDARDPIDQESVPIAREGLRGVGIVVAYIDRHLGTTYS
jgi:hypothetical protein